MPLPLRFLFLQVIRRHSTSGVSDRRRCRIVGLRADLKRMTEKALLEIVGDWLVNVDLGETHGSRAAARLNEFRD